MSLHLRLLGCLGHAVVDVRSGAATSKCGLPMWRAHGVFQLFIIKRESGCRRCFRGTPTGA